MLPGPGRRGLGVGVEGTTGICKWVGRGSGHRLWRSNGGLEHKVDGVALFDVVFLQELLVGESFAFQQESLMLSAG